jgi:hypothetical protein
VLVQNNVSVFDVSRPSGKGKVRNKIDLSYYFW